MTLSFTIKWKPDCRSRKQKGKDKTITRHVPTFSDWYSSSASAEDSVVSPSQPLGLGVTQLFPPPRGCVKPTHISLRSKRGLASSSRRLGREQKKRNDGRGGGATLFFGSRSNFRAITRLETLATQANILVNYFQVALFLVVCQMLLAVRARTVTGAFWSVYCIVTVNSRLLSVVQSFSSS